MQESIQHLTSRTRNVHSTFEKKVGVLKSVFDEFKKFAMRGNVVDLAVGVIVGGAFNKIVSSLVNDVIMPPLGLVLGKVNFSNLYFNLSAEDYESLAAARSAGAATINYGAFLNECVTFFITTCAVFVLVRSINRLRDCEEDASVSSPSTKQCPMCFTTIPLQALRCPACTSSLDSVR